MIRLERIEWMNVGMTAVAAVIAWVTGWLEPWSLALGGAVMGLNVWLMKSLVRRALRPQSSGRMAGALALLVGKFGLFLGLLGLLFWRVSLDGVSFAIGVTFFLIASVVEAVRVGFISPNED